MAKSIHDKITSLEEFLETKESRTVQRRSSDDNLTKMGRWSHDHLVAGAQSLHLPRIVALGGKHVFDMTGGHVTAQHLPEHLWWYAREVLRMQASDGQYGTILTNLWGTGGVAMYAPKPNKADPMKIDFFPDARAARDDRPITTTLAKFLGKVNLLLSEEYIRDLDAAYRAEMSDEVEFMSGVEHIREAYMGVHSCMGYRWHDVDSYPQFEGKHAVDAYDVPGVSIAVSRNGEGKINARCLVYQNPADEKDKRMIRVYGDSMLASRLKRRGFVYKAFTGVALRAIYSEKTPLGSFGYEVNHLGVEGRKKVKMIYAPYLDGVMGQHEEKQATKYFMIHEEEPDKLQLLTNEQYHRVQPVMMRLAQQENDASLNYAVQGITSNGAQLIRPIPKSITKVTCAVTGIELDMFLDNYKSIEVWKDGGLKTMLDTDDERVKEFKKTLTESYMTVDARGRVMTVLGPKDVPTFTAGWQQIIDTPANREHYGWAKYDPIKYPDRPNYVKAGSSGVDLRNHAARTPTRTAIKHSTYGPAVMIGSHLYDLKDTLVTLDEGLATVRVVGPTPPEGYKRVHSTARNVALYAHPNLKTVKVVTGRVCVPGFHDIVELTDGRWSFSRNVTTRIILGAQVRYLSGHPAEDIPVDSDTFRGMVRMVTQFFGNDDRYFYGRLANRNQGRGQIGQTWEDGLANLWDYYGEDMIAPSYASRRADHPAQHLIGALMTRMRRDVPDALGDESRWFVLNFFRAYRAARKQYLEVDFPEYAAAERASYGEVTDTTEPIDLAPLLAMPSTLLETATPQPVVADEEDEEPAALAPPMPLDDVLEAMRAIAA